MVVMSAGTHAGTASIPGRGDTVRLTHGEVLVEIRLAPFSFSVHRRGGTSVRAGEAWLAEGTARDVLLQFTEGVVPIEERSEPRRVVHARMLERRPSGATFSLLLQGQNTGALDIDVAEGGR